MHSQASASPHVFGAANAIVNPEPVEAVIECGSCGTVFAYPGNVIGDYKCAHCDEQKDLHLLDLRRYLDVRGEKTPWPSEKLSVLNKSLFDYNDQKAPSEPKPEKVQPVKTSVTIAFEKNFKEFAEKKADALKKMGRREANREETYQKILKVLGEKKRPMSSGKIAGEIGISYPTVKTHCEELYNLRLVTMERIGKTWMFNLKEA